MSTLEGDPVGQDLDQHWKDSTLGKRDVFTVSVNMDGLVALLGERSGKTVDFVMRYDDQEDSLTGDIVTPGADDNTTPRKTLDVVVTSEGSEVKKISESDEDGLYEARFVVADGTRDAHTVQYTVVDGNTDAATAIVVRHPWAVGRAPKAEYAVFNGTPVSVKHITGVTSFEAFRSMCRSDELAHKVDAEVRYAACKDEHTFMDEHLAFGDKPNWFRYVWERGANGKLGVMVVVDNDWGNDSIAPAHRDVGQYHDGILPPSPWDIDDAKITSPDGVVARASEIQAFARVYNPNTKQVEVVRRDMNNLHFDVLTNQEMYYNDRYDAADRMVNAYEDWRYGDKPATVMQAESEEIERRYREARQLDSDYNDAVELLTAAASSINEVVSSGRVDQQNELKDSRAQAREWILSRMPKRSVLMDMPFDEIHALAVDCGFDDMDVIGKDRSDVVDLLTDYHHRGVTGYKMEYEIAFNNAVDNIVLAKRMMAGEDIHCDGMFAQFDETFESVDEIFIDTKAEEAKKQAAFAERRAAEEAKKQAAFETYRVAEERRKEEAAVLNARREDARALLLESIMRNDLDAMTIAQLLDVAKAHFFNVGEGTYLTGLATKLEQEQAHRLIKKVLVFRDWETTPNTAPHKESGFAAIDNYLAAQREMADDTTSAPAEPQEHVAVEVVPDEPVDVANVPTAEPDPIEWDYIHRYMLPEFRDWFASRTHRDVLEIAYAKAQHDLAVVRSERYSYDKLLKKFNLFELMLMAVASGTKPWIMVGWDKDNVAHHLVGDSTLQRLDYDGSLRDRWRAGKEHLVADKAKPEAGLAGAMWGVMYTCTEETDFEVDVLGVVRESEPIVPDGVKAAFARMSQEFLDEGEDGEFGPELEIANDLDVVDDGLVVEDHFDTEQPTEKRVTDRMISTKQQEIDELLALLRAGGEEF